MNLMTQQVVNTISSFGTKPAILHGDEETSFVELAKMADALRPKFRAAGVGPGRPVLLSATNSAYVAAHVIAAWTERAIPVFCSPNAPREHVQHASTNCHAAFVYAPNQEAEVGQVEPHPDLTADMGSVVFTSGSTGNPKGVMQTQANLIDGAQRIGGFLGFDATTKILCPVPWSHDYGWGQLLSCLVLGVTLVLPTAPSVQGLSDAIEKHKPNWLAGTPSVFSGMIYGISDIRSADLSSIKSVTSTGSNLPAALVAELEGLLPGVAVYANYGLTETYRTTCLLPGDRAGREASVGKAVPGVEIAIRAADGKHAATGVKGQVMHRGAGVFAGYVGDPVKTSMMKPDEWVRTGDIGFIDQDGFLFLQGRSDRVIKSMDVQVSLDAVEACLMASGMALTVAVSSVEDKVLGQKVEAWVVLNDPENAKGFKKFARQALSKYQLPRGYHFIPSIPTTSSGKVDYRALQAA